MKPYILVGMPMVGKTTIGRLLGDILECKHIDLDSYIETKKNESAQNIINHLGENIFRLYEHGAIDDIISDNSGRKIIISTGGGAFCYDKTFDLIKKKATSIYLKEKLTVLEDRFKANLNNRPLLRQKEDLEKLYKIRMKYYEQADYIVECDDNTPEIIAKKIIKIIL